MLMQVQGTTPLWIAARVLLLERVDDFSHLRDNVLKTVDPEYIHDLRVASRRLREGLSLFAPCYGAENLAFMIKKLKQVTRLLGDIRNTDEAILFFLGLAAELGESYRSGMDQLELQFRKNRKREMKKLKTGLHEIMPKSQHGMFRGSINSPTVFNPSDKSVDLLAPLTGFAKCSLDGRLSDVLKLFPDARKHGEIKAQHLLRIAVKHYRYRMEMLAFLIGPVYEKLHSEVKSYQDVLGKMHDLDVFAGIIRDAAFPSQTEKTLQETIAAKREKLFAHFCAMQAASPFEKIGLQVSEWEKSE
jgi:CHAD domain-containing protein